VKKALISGITGQDGSYLAEFLLGKGYEVYGIIRRSSSFNTGRIDPIYEDPHVPHRRLHLVYGDLNDASSLNRIIRTIQPDEIYNLGAQSHVRVSFDIPEYTGEITGLGTIRLLEAIRESGLKPKFYQASSSEMFGKEAYDLFACNGILFNHESPRRGETFVTRKITKAAARIKLGLQQDLFLGNLDAKRDWGFAGDYIEAMWMMLQAKTPDDYVIATGETHTVKEMLELAFDRLQLDWKKHVKIDQKYYRPTEVDLLIGDASKAKRELGWQPKVRFQELIAMMVDADLAVEKEKLDGTRKRG